MRCDFEPLLFQRLRFAAKKGLIDVAQGDDARTRDLLQAGDQLVPATADSANGFRPAHSYHGDANRIVGADDAR